MCAETTASSSDPVHTLGYPETRCSHMGWQKTLIPTPREIDQHFPMHDPTSSGASQTSVAPRGPRRIRLLASAAINALPDEYRGLRETFRQTRSDMAEVRRIVAEDQGTILEGKATRADVAKYMAWRVGLTGGYQVTDDLYFLPAFIALKNSYGTPAAYLAINVAATGFAFTLGMFERRSQRWKAEAQGLQTVIYRGPMVDYLLDSTVNSAPYNVLLNSSKPREDGQSVELMSAVQIAGMSQAYGAVNTGFYAGSLFIPGLNSYAAFGVALGVMFQVKGTVRGYRERLSAQEAESSNPAKSDIRGGGVG